MDLVYLVITFCEIVIAIYYWPRWLGLIIIAASLPLDHKFKG